MLKSMKTEVGVVGGEGKLWVGKNENCTRRYRNACCMVVFGQDASKREVVVVAVARVVFVHPKPYFTQHSHRVYI